MLDKRRHDRVKDILDDPALFPDTFKTWIVKALETHPTFTLPQQQNTPLDKMHYVGEDAEPAFEGSWANYGGGFAPAAFYRDPFRRVWLSGLVKDGGAAPTTIFILPPAYRPPDGRQLYIAEAQGAIGRIDVADTGEVIHTAGTTGYVQLNGFSFRV